MRRASVHRKALVLGSDTRSFLSVMRSLGCGEMQVHVAWREADLPALHSQYVYTARALPPSQQPELEDHLESPVRSFAHPVGKLEDIGGQGVCSVQKVGYAWAVTTIKCWNTPHSNPYLLHRLSVDTWQHWLLLATMVSDVRQLFPNLLMTSIRFLLRFAGRTPLKEKEQK